MTVGVVEFSCPRCGGVVALKIDVVPAETACPSCGQAVSAKVATSQDLERSLKRAVAGGMDPVDVEAIRHRLASVLPDEDSDR